MREEIEQFIGTAAQHLKEAEKALAAARASHRQTKPLERWVARLKARCAALGGA